MATEAAADVEAPPVCYICFNDVDPATDVSPCVCRALVHPHCLLKSINHAEMPRCTICKSPFARLKEAHYHTLQCTEPSVIKLCCGIAGATLFGVAFYFFARAIMQRFDGAFYELHLGCALLFGICGTVAAWISMVVGYRQRALAALVVRRRTFRLV